MSILKKLLRDTCGQDLAEYGIALAVIGLGAGLAALAIATDVNTIWSQALNVINSAV